MKFFKRRVKKVDKRKKKLEELKSEVSTLKSTVDFLIKQEERILSLDSLSKSERDYQIGLVQERLESVNRRLVVIESDYNSLRKEVKKC